MHLINDQGDEYSVSGIFDDDGDTAVLSLVVSIRVDGQSFTNRFLIGHLPELDAEIDDYLAYQFSSALSVASAATIDELEANLGVTRVEYPIMGLATEILEADFHTLTIKYEPLPDPFSGQSEHTGAIFVLDVESHPRFLQRLAEELGFDADWPDLAQIIKERDSQHGLSRSTT